MKLEYNFLGRFHKNLPITNIIIFLEYNINEVHNPIKYQKHKNIAIKKVFCII